MVRAHTSFFGARHPTPRVEQRDSWGMMSLGPPRSLSITLPTDHLVVPLLAQEVTGPSGNGRVIVVRRSSDSRRVTG